jgi:hypothetical protein
MDGNGAHFKLAHDNASTNPTAVTTQPVVNPNGSAADSITRGAG